MHVCEGLFLSNAMITVEEAGVQRGLEPLIFHRHTFFIGIFSDVNRHYTAPFKIQIIPMSITLKLCIACKTLLCNGTFARWGWGTLVQLLLISVGPIQGIFPVTSLADLYPINLSGISVTHSK